MITINNNNKRTLCFFISLGVAVEFSATLFFYDLDYTTYYYLSALIYSALAISTSWFAVKYLLSYRLIILSLCAAVNALLNWLCADKNIYYMLSSMIWDNYLCWSNLYRAVEVAMLITMVNFKNARIFKSVAFTRGSRVCNNVHKVEV